MKASVHIHFSGQCQQAFEYYRDVLGAVVGSMLPFGRSPAADKVPSEWHDKIVHADIHLHGLRIAGDDVPPDQYQQPTGFFILLQPDTEEDTTRIFDALSIEGAIILPLQKTFWSPCYGIVKDRFGVTWKLNFGG